MGRYFFVLSILLQSTSLEAAEEADMRIARGEALARDTCAACHAIGRTGRSPHATAPAFRALEPRIDLDTFFYRVRQGLTSGHPDMPTFRFARDDARIYDASAYLRLDGNTIVFSRFKGGKLVQIGTIVVSQDGKSRTNTTSGILGA